MQHKYIDAGFTLTELLAVVIIVALLSSLSLGYYKRSVEQSRFSEGLGIASMLAEAVNQAYLDDRLFGVEDTTAKKKRKVKTLDAAVANSKSCSSSTDYCIGTPRFEVYVEEKGGTAYVRAYRGTPSSYIYYIEIQPSFASSNKEQISCNANKTFCESMGYTNCNTEGTTCTK